MRIFSVIICLFLGTLSFAQDLNCRVVINADGVELSDKSIFTEMQVAIQEFMNNTKWSQDIYQPEERIKVNLFITITEMPSLNNFRAKVQITSARPVFNSNYESLLFNYLDEDWAFVYAQSQPLIFSENRYDNELSSLLGFFANVMVGIDNDSFGSLSGKPYYVKAQNILVNAQQAGGPGWQSFGSSKSRYWVQENLNNQVFDPFRQSIYEYHRQGLDLMSEQPEVARKNIANSLGKIQTVLKQVPLSSLINFYLDGKRNEIISLYQQGDAGVKKQAHDILIDIDPTKTDEYKKILNG